MGSIDLLSLERRLKRRYELSRAGLAALGVSPALLLVAAALYWGKHPSLSVVCGGALLALGGLLLWLGREWRRAVLPGLAWGALPLALALCANHFPHVCMGQACGSWCVPACATGGLIAGVGMAALGRRHPRPLLFWASGSALALLTGAMGCACVGYSGILGLLAGYGCGLLPLGLHRLTQPQK